MGGRRNKKVVPFRIPFHLNIGGFAFLVIFIYICSIFIIYMNKPRISVYEVLEKKISDNNSCVGMVFRQETIVNTNNSGYLNFYYGDGTKIAKGAKVYTLDETGEIYNMLKESNMDNSFSKEEREMLWDNIADFRSTYSKNQYQSVSDFVYDIDNSLLELSNSSIEKKMKKILENNNVSSLYHSIKTDMSGIISYSIDGYENTKPEDVTSKMFSMDKYEKKQLRSSEKVEKGEAAYKLVTDESWKLVLNLSEDLYKRLVDIEKKSKNTSYISITFTREDLSATVPFHTFTKKDGYFAEVDLNNYIIHFINDRFLDIEINLTTVEGLKIPNTAIIEKEFYTVPENYFTEGGDSGDTGLIQEAYDKSGEVTFKFVRADKYYVSEDGTAYIDKDLFSDGVWIRNQETQERYQIGKTSKLKGVYNINYGYCLFRMVKILYKNEEYCIVQSGLENGAANYDHIVVDAATVTEDAMIHNYKGQ
ncbi:MAG: hypothetical protein HFJ09_10090 [Lachnospiraceae bacterium]|nr:hypothetical protein [Lachnospiraceae bacterium]